MASRGADQDYATARLIQEAIGNDPGALSFGVWNAESQLTAADSHGDDGVVLIDCANDYRCKCMGGYLVVDKSGNPKVKQ